MLTQKKIQHAGARKGMKGMCRACLEEEIHKNLLG